MLLRPAPAPAAGSLVDDDARRDLDDDDLEVVEDHDDGDDDFDAHTSTGTNTGTNTGTRDGTQHQHRHQHPLGPRLSRPSVLEHGDDHLDPGTAARAPGQGQPAAARLRRTPCDVETEPGGARPAGGFPGEPATLVLHDQPGLAVLAVEHHPKPAGSRGVGEDVVDQHVDEVGQVLGGEPRPGADRRAGCTSVGRPWSSASALPVVGALPDDGHGVGTGGEVGADRPAGLADDRVDGALEDADVVLEPLARPGSATASESRRSAVTGVRSRWERSATASRSSVSSSVVRSARPLSARASSSVSSVPRTSARAERSPSRSWWATPATPSSGWLMRRPSHVSDRRSQCQQQDAEADEAEPRLGHAPAQVGRGDAGAHHRGAVAGDDRQQHAAARVVDHGERLALAGPLVPRGRSRSRPRHRGRCRRR